MPVPRNSLIRRLFILAAAIALWNGVPSGNLSVVTEAGAQSHRSGVILGSGKRHYKKHHHKRVVPVYRDKALQRLGFRKQRSLGTGHHRKHKRHYGIHKPTDLLFVERRRRIEARNRAIRLERAGIVHSRHHAHNPPVVPNERQGIITSGYSDTGVAGPVVTVVTPCPARHTCGYRLYEDGTGPRIITPGLSGDGLPAQDGLSGPRVITLD